LDVETGQIGDAPAELHQEWDVPDSVRIGDSTTWNHVLEEVNGETPITGIEIVYRFKEDGEVDEVPVPTELDAGERRERMIRYAPIKPENGSFQADYVESLDQLQVTDPVSIPDGENSEQVITEADPENYEDSTTDTLLT